MLWSRSVDAFAIGCIISELYLGDNLFSFGIDTDREHLATVDKIVGPFPEDYAHEVEDKLPGTFTFEESTSIRFPPESKPLTDEDLSAPMKRLEQTKPLAVSGWYITVFLCSASYIPLSGTCLRSYPT